MTGRAPPADRLSARRRPWFIPDMAAWSPRRARRSAGMLPPYVAVPDAPIFASSGYLTPAYDPFAVSRRPQPAGLPRPRT